MKTALTLLVEFFLRLMPHIYLILTRFWGFRIASTLNLAYYIGLMATMRQKIQSGDFWLGPGSGLGKMEGKKGM
ncbi:MAG: hypothetical protein Ct9H300mP9_4260 [Candidatus Neomarinimicrobiota bacterium]|nr:MAG: hypothetical protein Ct9H300mP9_4260 [Candidatus Neomarinimicrobiota bacterium]